jgi:hypothetical protein
LGTYNPKLELTEVNTGANMISFENSTLVSKSKFLDESKLLKKKLSKQNRSKSNFEMSIIQGNKEKNREEEEEFIPRRKEHQLNGSKSLGLFTSSLPDIPLDEVFNQRTKIRAIIMDIKSNIYKMDKL